MQAAIAHGDLEEVAAILKRTPVLSTHKFKDARKDLQSPLNFACLLGNLECVQLLLKNGADKDLTFQDAKRRFLLQCAVESRNVVLVEAALAGEIIPPNYLRIMLREKTTLGQTVFHLSAGLPSSEILEKLIATLPEENDELRVAQLDAVQDSCGMTPLMIASTAGSVACATVLLEAKASINSQKGPGQSGDGVGCTALILAAMEGHAEVVNLLLSMKADAAVKDVNGDTALSWALLMEHANIAKTLGHAGDEPLDSEARLSDISQALPSSSESAAAAAAPELPALSENEKRESS